MIDTNIFRAYDIRGVYDQTLTDEIMAKIGYLLGDEGEEVVVGNDVRFSGEELARALISGLLAKKTKVYYSGTGSFGQILYSGLGKDKILFITASHLSKEWNGLKMFYGDGVPIFGKKMEELKRDIQNLKAVPIFDNALDMVIRIDSGGPYKKFIKKKFNLKKKKVVVDCNCASTCSVAPEILKELGMDVISINDKVDTSFRNKNPNIHAEDIQELKERVIKEKADLGMAFDGDGDRVAIVDETGRIIGGNEIGVILGKYYIEKNKKGTIINTISCSMVGEKLLKSKGAKFVTAPVGHTYVGNACKEHNALMGYEESCHIFLTEYFYFEDGFIVPLKLMQIMEEKGKKLSELVDEIPIYPFLKKDFASTDNKKFGIVERIGKKLKEEYKNINNMDGIKIIFDDGWILIRCSNTNPEIKLYVEALTKERLKELEDKFTKIIEEEIK